MTCRSHHLLESEESSSVGVEGIIIWDPGGIIIWRMRIDVDRRLFGWGMSLPRLFAAGGGGEAANYFAALSWGRLPDHTVSIEFV